MVYTFQEEFILYFSRFFKGISFQAYLPSSLLRKPPSREINAKVEEGG